MSDGAMNVLAGLSEFSMDSFHQYANSFLHHSEEQQVSFLMLLLSLPGSDHEFGKFVRELEKMLRNGVVEPRVAAYAVLVLDAFGRESPLPQEMSPRYSHDKTVQSANRILALRRHAFPEENPAPSSVECSRHEYDSDLTWFRELDDGFLLPLAHSRLQISAIAQAMDALPLPKEYFDALESFSSTGHQHGFILAQLYMSQGNIKRSKELIESLLEMFDDSLPEPAPTQQLMHDVEQVLQNFSHHPRRLPWAEPKSELFWKLIHNGL